MSDAHADTCTTKNAQIKVYTLTRREMISHDYHVPARSLKEALMIFNHPEIDEYIFKDHDTHNHIRYYAAKSSHQTSLHDFDVYGPCNSENGSDLDHLELV